MFDFCDAPCCSFLLENVLILLIGETLRLESFEVDLIDVML